MGQEKERLPAEFTREQELSALRDMLLIRRFRGEGRPALRHGAIAASAISISARRHRRRYADGLKMADQVITGYRDHGHMLATGMEARGDGRTDRTQGGTSGQGRLHAHVQQEKNFFADTASSGAQFRSARVSPSPPLPGNDFVSLAYFGTARRPGQVSKLQHGGLWKLP